MAHAVVQSAKIYCVKNAFGSGYNRQEVITERLHVARLYPMDVDRTLYAQLNKCKHSVINNVLIIGFYAFRNQCLTSIVFNAFDAQQFH